jgi:PAS domain S-box-containing protein
MAGKDWSTEELIAELRESEERFRTICENAPVMIDQFDENGRCKLWNRECEKQLGYTREEMVSLADPLPLFYPDPEERARVLRAIAEADGKFREYRVRAKDGRERIQLWADFRLPNGTQISVGHDVTEQRATEAQLRRSQKMDALGQLTGGMAHDFNNLLTVILANAELLQHVIADPAQALEAQNEIIGSATRGAALIRKLLAFSRREVMKLTAVDPSVLVNDIAPTLTRLLPDSIRVIVQTDPSLPNIEVDPGSVEQMLFNLATNARDAMAGDGLLTLSVLGRWLDDEHARELDCAPGDYVALEVRDDGSGMDDITKRRMFEPFFTTKEGSGTGLGMPMVYGLMKQQAGTVTVVSHIGGGTAVQLLFPVSKRQRGPGSITRLARVGSKRVLLVEDLAPVRRVTEAMLVDAGYHVEPVPDGERALELLRKMGHGFDVVLCDVVMPNMGGAELFREVKKLPNAPPFVFVTGYAREDLLDSLRADGAVKIVRKPYRMDVLIGALSELFAPQSAASANIDDD